MNASRFWIVCNPDRMGFHTPRMTYTNYFKAATEARRLAGENPGQVFHVMASCEAFCKQDVASMRFNEDMTENSGDVPF